MKKGKKSQQENVKEGTKQTKMSQQQDWQSIKRNGNGYVITVNAKPNAKQTKVTQVNQQFIGVSIAAPPRQGQANQELVSYIAGVLNAKKSAVYVDKGGKSRNKMVIVEDSALTVQEIVGIFKKQI